jgi:transcription initiation factor TFIIIB Brf1 subunit/transcription initiation factor TFIIB
METEYESCPYCHGKKILKEIRGTQEVTKCVGECGCIIEIHPIKPNG